MHTDLKLGIDKISVNKDIIDTLYEKKNITIPNTTVENINGYALLQDEIEPKHSILVRYIGNNKFTSIANKGKISFEGITPKDARQTVFMDSLTVDNILISTCIGSAGTGKTTIAMAYALEQYLKSRRSILLTKPTTIVGGNNAFGPVPGDIDEKYAPYLSSYEIIMKKLGGDKGREFFNMMKLKEELKFIPIEMTRGCTFENCTLIVDEAQNLRWHELNTIISRMGENSKIIVLGDLNQIDIDIDWYNTGLAKMLMSPPYHQSSYSSAIELVTQYRSPITALITEVNKWIATHD